jgi:hypothetical protein
MVPSAQSIFRRPRPRSATTATRMDIRRPIADVLLDMETAPVATKRETAWVLLHWNARHAWEPTRSKICAASTIQRARSILLNYRKNQQPHNRWSLLGGRAQATKTQRGIFPTNPND